jgi:hypothetical protein
MWKSLHKYKPKIYQYYWFLTKQKEAFIGYMPAMIRSIYDKVSHRSFLLNELLAFTEINLLPEDNFFFEWEDYNAERDAKAGHGNPVGLWYYDERTKSKKGYYLGGYKR